MNRAPDMTSDQETTSSADSGFFRCPVSADNNDALIRVGRRKIDAQVQETSIDGFTVLVSPKNVSKLKVGRTWVLQFDGATVEVHPQWMFNSPNGHVQMGLRRLRDLTQPTPQRSSLLAKFGGRRYEDPNFSAVAFGGFVLALFLCLALPGLGDRLGTSDRIQSTVKWLVSELNQTISPYI